MRQDVCVVLASGGSAAPAALIVLFIVLSIALQMRGDSRCREHVDSWAAREGVTVHSATRRWFALTPFFRSRQQRVYDVEVTDSEGRRRKARLKVGGWMTGALSDDVKPCWSDER